MKTVSNDFKTAFEQSTMQVKSRVIMEFGNNSFNSSASTFDINDPTSTDDQRVTASSTKLGHRGIDGTYQQDTFSFWSPGDVYNNKNRNSMRWLVLDHGATFKDENDLGCFRVIDAEDIDLLGSPAYERGWWSSAKSNGSGVFTSPEWVQSVWDDPRPINRVTLYTMEGYDNMASVTVQYYASGWHTVATTTLSPTQYINSWDISTVVITGLRVYINSTHVANDFARCNELQGYYIADISDDIINDDIDEQKEEFVNTVPVGIARANLCNLTLQNIDQFYSPANTSSPYYPYIAANNRFTLEYGIKKPDTTYEYTPMGEFYVDEWHVDGSALTASVTSRDFSKFLQDEKVFNLGKVWHNTTVNPVIRDVLARAGKAPDEININPTSERTYQVIFLKDKTFWLFMTELSFADQGTFGFDEIGHFFYETYAAVNNPPNNVSTYTFDHDTNIVSGSEVTELYINSVIVKISQYKTSNLATAVLWEATPADALDVVSLSAQQILSKDTTASSTAGSDVVLTWNFLGADITATSTTIPVTLNNDDQSFDKTFGYILIDKELIHYQDRTATTFTNCTRGYCNTKPDVHTAGTLVGRAKFWDMVWQNAPALSVKYPFSTAIDELELFKTEEGTPQAAIIFYSKNAFGGQLAIGNIVPYYTILKGTGRSQKEDIQINWATVIAGTVVVAKGTRQEIGGVTGRTVSAGRNVRYIRRYGKSEIVIDNPWIQSVEHADTIRRIYFDEYKNPRQLITLQVVGNPALQLNDRVTISNYPQLNIVNKEYNLLSAHYTYDGGLLCDILLREVKS